MFSFPKSLLFNGLLFFLVQICSLKLASEEKDACQCKFIPQQKSSNFSHFFEVGECTHWRILLVPMLTDRFNQIPLLKAIIRSMLSGCRWYFHDQIGIQMFTKNNSFIPITDPILLPELNQMVFKSIPSNYFSF